MDRHSPEKLGCGEEDEGPERGTGEITSLEKPTRNPGDLGAGVGGGEGGVFC